MNNKPLITVYLLTYNHIDSFEKAIESVLEQKTSFPYKIVILDDASTDGTSDIVRKYENYPNVKCVIREVNAQGRNLYLGLQDLDTKYFTVLETDDYWCDENKLQKQIDALEANPDCSFCAHNTIERHLETGAVRKYVTGHETKKFSLPKKLNKKFYIEPHTSSRTYRSEFLDFKNVTDSIVLTYDIGINFYYLTKGNMYYIDEVMSVYNYTNKGIFSGKPPLEQRHIGASIVHRLNKEFNFKYNKLLVRLFAFKLSIKGINYLLLKYTKNTKKLDSLYTTQLENFRKRFLNKNCDIKIIWELRIPYGKGKRYIFEFKREKDRV